MTSRGRRWLLVGALVVAVVVAPIIVRAWPAGDSDVSDVSLRDRIRGSDSTGWSGEVRTQGTLQIPDTDSFGGVARLLGEESTLRVWWGDALHWRVDRIRSTGETDLVRDGFRMIRWVFESRRATIAAYSDVRLPDDSDLLPSRLAARMLTGATADELARLPARRIAGHAAPGLRFRPSGDLSTVRQIDVWAEPETGLPLRVEVFDDEGQPVVTSRVVRLDKSPPPEDVTRFAPAPGVRIRSQDSLDVAAGANAFAPYDLPGSLAELDRRGDPAQLGAVGVYGRGPTALVAIPLRRSVAGRVREQISTSTNARETAAGTALEVGPLSVLLTRGGRDRGTFVLGGTVTPAVLQNAAADLRTGVVRR
ncbi:sigma-E factor regulatory protein RseB domain-containing protein [Aeromicrobium sp.]|uniref:sigma-E factor regulatory protein RseB domain-containing protein n=1 Tax=Aeromicrobium sp. TaxID=1871063 RepID=UPI003D6B9B18